MAKVTINIEGTSDEVAEYLQKLTGGKVEGRIKGVSWLPEEIEILYTNLRPEAQRILREIAKNPTGYNKDDLISLLGLTEGDRRRIHGEGLAGRLSSIEFKRKRLFPRRPRPIELDRETRRKYIMLPEVAEWIIANATP